MVVLPQPCSETPNVSKGENSLMILKKSTIYYRILRKRYISIVGLETAGLLLSLQMLYGPSVVIFRIPFVSLISCFTAFLYGPLDLILKS